MKFYCVFCALVASLLSFVCFAQEPKQPLPPQQNPLPLGTFPNSLHGQQVIPQIPNIASGTGGPSNQPILGRPVADSEIAKLPAEDVATAERRSLKKGLEKLKEKNVISGANMLLNKVIRFLANYKKRIEDNKDGKDTKEMREKVAMIINHYLLNRQMHDEMKSKAAALQKQLDKLKAEEAHLQAQDNSQPGFNPYLLEPTLRDLRRKKELVERQISKLRDEVRRKYNASPHHQSELKLQSLAFSVLSGIAFPQEDQQ